MNLKIKKVVELQKMAKKLGIKNVTIMRKAELIKKIEELQNKNVVKKSSKAKPAVAKKTSSKTKAVIKKTLKTKLSKKISKKKETESIDSDLKDKKVVELQKIAKKLGVTSTTIMRKAELIKAIIKLNKLPKTKVKTKRTELHKKSKSELLDMADSLKIAVEKSTKKEDLIAVLSSAQQKAIKIKKVKAKKTNAGKVIPETDMGLPIPHKYEKDRLVLMEQEPNKIFAYWEITEGTMKGLYEEHGSLENSVLIIKTSNGEERRIVDLSGGKYYLKVDEKQDYSVQLAFQNKSNETFVFLESNEITTQPFSPSMKFVEGVIWGEKQESKFKTLMDDSDLPNSFKEYQSFGSMSILTEREEWLSSHSLSSSSLIKK